MSEIDRLEISVEAQATKANQQLDKLITKLNSVSSSLSKVNASGLTGLAGGVAKLAASMQSMNTVKTADFTRLTKNIERMGSLNTSGINSTASSFITMGKALNSLSAVSANAVQIGEVSKNISKLGNKSVTRAIDNIPKLSAALSSMMSEMSRAPKVSANLIRMTEALAQLSAQGSKMGAATKSMTSGLKGYVGTSNKASKSTLSLAASFGKLYANLWLVQRAFKALFSAVGSSMDYLETLNYFDVTVDKLGKEAASQWQEQGYDSAEAYYSSFRNRMTDLTAKMTGFQINADGTTTELNNKNLGLDPEVILNYQATFSQMADSMGVLEDTALNVSSAFTMLGADWASLKNLDMDVAMQKFASALAGEIEPVRGLGLDISQTTLQMYALKYGISESVSEMSQAAKVQLRLLAILDQSKVAFGDMANTIQSPANQVRLLKQNFANLSRTIGNMFLPIVSKILPYINGLVIALRRLFTWLSGLMGVDISSLSTSIGDSSLDMGGLADDTSDVVDGLEDATKQAEELKNVTMGIDELNIATQDKSSSSGSSSEGDTSSGGYGVLDDAIAAALADYQAAWDKAFAGMENKAESIADKIQAAFQKIYDIAEPTRLAVKKLWDEGLSLFGNFAWTALQDFWNEFLVPLGTWTLGTGLPMLIEAINNFLLKINWEKINAALKNFWQALEPFLENVGVGLIHFFSDLLSIGADFINVIVPGSLNGIAEALKKISPEQAERIGYALGVIGTALLGLKTIGAVATGIQTLSAAIAGSNVVKGFNVLAGGVKTVGSLIGKFLEFLGIGKLLTKFTPFATLSTDMALTGASLPQLLKGLILTPIATFFTTTLPAAFVGLAGTIGSALGLAGTAGIVAGGGIIIAAIAAVVAGIVYTVTHFDEIKEFWTKKVPAWWSGKVVPFFEKLPGEIAGFFKSLPSKLGYALGFALGTMVKWTANLITTAKTEIPKVISNIVSFFTVDLPTKITKALADIIIKFTLFTINFVTNIKTEFPKVINAMLDYFTGLPDKFKEFGENIIDGLKNGVAQKVEDFKTALFGFVSGFVKGFKDALGIHSPSTVFAEIGGFIISGLKQGVENAWTAFITFMAGLPKKIVDTFSTIKDKFTEKGKNIIEGIQDGWNNLSTSFSTWLGQKRESVVTSFGSYLSKFVTKGNDIINGIKQGWNNLSSEFSSWLGQKRESVVSWFGSFYNNFITKGNEIITGIQKGWNNLSASFATWLGQKRDEVVSWFGDLKSKFVTKGSDIISGIQKGWNDNWSSFKEWLSGLPAKIVAGIGSMYDKGKALIKDFIDGFKSISMPKFKINVSFVDDGGLRAQLFKAMGFDGYPSLSWSFYANGGLPNYGEAFIARENGPEMVGRIGNKSAVVNNDQITTSISNAVVKAMADANISNSNDALLREQNELLRQILAKDTNFNLNGRKVNEELDNSRRANGFSFT